jgi:hypothetical protein
LVGRIDIVPPPGEHDGVEPGFSVGEPAVDDRANRLGSIAARDDTVVACEPVDGSADVGVANFSQCFASALDRWLGSLFDDKHLDDTCDRLAGVSEPDPSAQERQAELRAAIADCDRKLANYRALLEYEDAITGAASWIAETQRERRNLERQLGQHVPGDPLTAEQVKVFVMALKDIVSVRADAEPADRADLYAQLGREPRIRPRRDRHRRVAPCGVMVRVGGGT